MKLPSTMRGISARHVTLVLAAALVPGCAVQATEEWAAHARDAVPRVLRVELENAIVERGLVVATDLVASDRPEGFVARSVGLAAGYGVRDLAKSSILDVGVVALGRAAVGKPVMMPSPTLELGTGPRVELLFGEGKDRKHERFEIVGLHPEVVASLDATGWLAPRPFFDVQGGIGLRLSVVTAAGPPILRSLRSLF